jgi:bifunctional UDP-N-acetylglucosamine pyrophosphorylase/glucosamine-1-phosphate N-acetyltransferase
MAPKHKHKFSSIILAAGKGTRMHSDRPKVMHLLAGKPLIAHVVAVLSTLSPDKIVAITAPGADEVKQAALKENHLCVFAEQQQQLGTGHAASCAEPLLSSYSGTILVLCGDTPLITPDTISRALETAQSAEIVVVGMRLPNPVGYGRLVVDKNGQLEEIVEERDATPEHKQITLCNSGLIAVSSKHLFTLLKKIRTDNAASEYYLTDIISLADEQGLHCHVVEADATELTGINTRTQLAEAEQCLQKRLRSQAMERGVSMPAPDTVHLSADTKIGRDVIIHPYVVFGKGVTVEDKAEIRSFSHIEGATIKTSAVIGPFARVRPGTVIGEGARVGNFVEIKNSTLQTDAKINHLSYIGDATVGEGANVGAGTITCNFDGELKHKTFIGRNAFIGSNSALVAPVSVGEGAVVGAGSVITEDVPPAALSIARGKQVNKLARAKEIKKKEA